jgi:hypothetical protein
LNQKKKNKINFKVSRRKERVKMRAKINEMENRKTIGENQWNCELQFLKR